MRFFSFFQIYCTELSLYFTTNHTEEVEETSQVGFLIFLKNYVQYQNFESTLLKLEICMNLEVEHGGIRALFISTICTAKLRKYMAHDVVT